MDITYDLRFSLYFSLYVRICSHKMTEIYDRNSELSKPSKFVRLWQEKKDIQPYTNSVNLELSIIVDSYITQKNLIIY